MFESEKVTDDLIMGFVEDYPCLHEKSVEDYPYVCEGFCVVTVFEIHYRKSFSDQQSLRKIYDSLSRLRGSGKIVWDEEIGYKVAKNV